MISRLKGGNKPDSEAWLEQQNEERQPAPDTARIAFDRTWSTDRRRPERDRLARSVVLLSEQRVGAGLSTRQPDERQAGRMLVMQLLGGAATGC